MKDIQEKKVLSVNGWVVVAVDLAVLVFSGSQVVLASVRGDPEALIELALQQGRDHASARLAQVR